MFLSGKAIEKVDTVIFKMKPHDMNKRLIDFESLVDNIVDINHRLRQQVSKAVNTALTLRNWLIGFYVHEYELRGEDRAKYGERVIDSLAARLNECGVPRSDTRELRRYRLFFLTYPQIRDSLSPELISLIPSTSIVTNNRDSASPESYLSGKDILNNLSFTHLRELIAIEDSVKRAFYEVESIRGRWSVRELKRQINSLYYERSGLSINKQKLSELTQASAERTEQKLAIRDPYIFEFLGLKPTEVMSESDLEAQLVDKIEGFLLELGHGFCFEARQKRILIGDEHFFVDLVFYHRLLKCHVLVELKLEKFSQENIGQLNTYVSWYCKNMMAEGDNPPIGILLCTDKNHALVEYALAGMDNNLFVSKYLLELPDKETMQQFIETQIREVER